MPDGLTLYATLLSTLYETVCKIDVVIMADVTYGACCVDDYTAIALGCDYMIHYGHSCLVPVNTTGIPTLYVFVEIGFQVEAFIQSVIHNFPKESKMAVMGTIQFISGVHEGMSHFPTIS